MFLLVAYDIMNAKRLRKVAAMMENYGTRVQRSVFECELADEQLPALLSDIKRLIGRREDKVQIYPLCRPCRARLEICGPGERTFIPDVFVL
jgi:CRISPR-associated protein Cas2